jgi:hypothetical protein
MDKRQLFKMMTNSETKMIQGAIRVSNKKIFNREADSNNQRSNWSISCKDGRTPQATPA